MPDVKAPGSRKSELSTQLPRLAPIEEIDATTDLTRVGRKRPFMSIPDGRDDARKPRPADSPHFPERFGLRRGWVLIAFVAGFTLGLSTIGVARACFVDATTSAVKIGPLPSARVQSTTPFARARADASSTDADSL